LATQENLNEAFAGESQANRKYLAFASKAEADGFPQIARLFRAAAEAETVHAHAHLRVMGEVRNVADNLQTAIDGEGFEFQKMYPKFVAEAEKEGNRPAATSFKYAMAVEEIHYKLYSDALATFKSGKDLPDRRFFICPVCGNTVLDGAPDKCAICGMPGQRFTEIK
jgi:rubrerythrin